MKLVECVPNFSEGRDRAVLDAIAAAIAGTEGVDLLDMDPGAATNRTVFTFVGSPNAVAEAAFRAAASAAERIDMRRHRGEHARIGAMDVCPFVPVAGVTMAECVEIARRVGERIGTELRIPVYLYEAAATRPERRNLADVRRGEYEGLAAKLADPEWRPDHGPADFNPRSGATAVGAREFLIAYNINLNTRERRLAHDIALEIREAGRILRDDQGRPLRDDEGRPRRAPGMFREVKAVGWIIEEFGRAQISINLTNYKVSPPHAVFDAVCRLAEERGLRVTGSELVGLIPRDAILMAGRHYLARQGKTAGVPEARLVEAAVQSLGLNDVKPFVATERIVEARVAPAAPLASLSLREFADETSTDSPAPGGGSVAALCGALASALAAMVAALTHGRKGHEEAWDEMDHLAQAAQQHKDGFLQAVDDDTKAFDGLMEAHRLPRKTPAETAARAEAMQVAAMEAVQVPLAVLRRATQVLPLIRAAAERGNPNSVSDAGVAAALAGAAAEGALLNVLINLPQIEDDTRRGELRNEAEALASAARAEASTVGTRVRAGLAP